MNGSEIKQILALGAEVIALIRQIAEMVKAAVKDIDEQENKEEKGK